MFYTWWLMATISIFIMYIDVKKRTIPNNTIVFILTLCFIKMCFLGDLSILPYSFVILIIGFFLHIFNILAAGDTKLLFAFSLAISPEFLPLSLFIITALGGVLALVYYLYGLCTDLEKVKKRGVPYGVPICLGSLFGIAASF